MQRTLLIVGACLIGLALIVGLSGCSPEPAGVGCPRLSAWSGEDQKALGAAYHAEPSGSIVRRAVDDLQFMRDQSRACAGQHIPK